MNDFEQEEKSGELAVKVSAAGPLTRLTSLELDVVNEIEEEETEQESKSGEF